MNDLDTFRAALHGPVDGRPPALDDIMKAGRELRRKRRLATVTVAAAALVVAAGATATVWPAQAPPPARAGDSPSPSPTVADGPDGSWGQAVDTGIRQGNRDVVITAYRSDNPSYPDIKFGVRVCAVTTDGQLNPCKNTLDDTAPDRSPGFHSISMPTTINEIGLPMHGYYVGPAATITAKARGKLVTAQTAPWSGDPNVVLFWFSLDQVNLQPDKNHPAYAEGKITPDEYPEMSDWTARDAAGKVLPLGKPKIWT